MKLKATQFDGFERLACRFEVKEATEGDGLGRFSGIAAVYNVVDLHNEVVKAGAFTKTLQQKGPKRPLLWQHLSDQPIGSVELLDAPQGLLAKAEVDLDVTLGRQAFSGAKKGYVTGLSIGFNAVVDRFDRERNVRELSEIDLWEVSLVTFPANPQAQVTTTKALAALTRLPAEASLGVVCDRIEALVGEFKTGRALTDAAKARVKTLIGHMSALVGETIPTKTADETAFSGFLATIREEVTAMGALRS